MSNWQDELGAAIKSKKDKSDSDKTIVKEFLVMALEAFNELEPVLKEAGRVGIYDGSQAESRIAITIKNKKDSTEKTGYTTAKLDDPNEYDFAYIIEARTKPGIGWRPRVQVRGEAGDIAEYRLHGDDDPRWYVMRDMTKDRIKAAFTRSYKNPGRW